MNISNCKFVACPSFVQYQQLLSLFLELIKPCQNCLFLLLSFGQPANWNVDTFGLMKTMNILNIYFYVRGRGAKYYGECIKGKGKLDPPKSGHRYD